MLGIAPLAGPRRGLLRTAGSVRRDKLVELGLHPTPLRLGEPVDVQYAVEVVVLVLEDTRLPAHQLLAPHLPLRVLVLDLDPARPLDIRREAREGEAPLHLDRPARPRVDDARVAEHHLAQPLLLPPLRVEHHQPLIDAELRRREPDAARGVHDRKHLLSQSLQPGVKVADLRVRRAQQRVRVLQDTKRGAGDSTRVHLLLGQRRRRRRRQLRSRRQRRRLRLGLLLLEDLFRA
mmetsp:Transcript_43121/g.135200  ORF Transcript_43121/g.135200 Transcript_43121/m.135200 type:complete len:234 (+) Transcript_43121:165-866(+)